MRARKEIEADDHALSSSSALMLEVLLDIRDLLQGQPEGEFVPGPVTEEKHRRGQKAGARR